MITIHTKGKFTNTEKFLHGIKNLSVTSTLNKYGAIGVAQLKAATPTKTGDTANSWSYEISTTSKGSSITWVNSSNAGGVPVVILLQYGHGTRNGGYVQGIDFINPALQKIFRNLTDEIWKEVTKL